MSGKKSLSVQTALIYSVLIAALPADEYKKKGRPTVQELPSPSEISKNDFKETKASYHRFLEKQNPHRKQAHPHVQADHVKMRCR